MVLFKKICLKKEIDPKQLSFPSFLFPYTHKKRNLEKIYKEAKLMQANHNCPKLDKGYLNFMQLALGVFYKRLVAH